MKCPRCENEELRNVFLKVTNSHAFLCHSCATAWLDSDFMGYDTGHKVHSFNSEDREYYLDDFEEENDSSWYVRH